MGIIGFFEKAGYNTDISQIVSNFLIFVLWANSYHPHGDVMLTDKNTKVHNAGMFLKLPCVLMKKAVVLKKIFMCN
jgi:hypothetical protein